MMAWVNNHSGRLLQFITIAKYLDSTRMYHSMKPQRFGLGCPLQKRMFRLERPGMQKPSKTTEEPTRKIFIATHAERIDYNFTSKWVEQCFDKEGNFSPINENLPRFLPKRKGGHQEYELDCPITKCGIIEAFKIGRSMRKLDITINEVYSSPALCSVQTTTALLAGLSIRQKLKIKIEPGLFEWMAFHDKKQPSWLSPKELEFTHGNFDLDYKPFIESQDVLNLKEKLNDFKIRAKYVIRNIYKANATGNALIVANPSFTELCFRQYLNGSLGAYNDLKKATPNMPYCKVLELSLINDNEWKVTKFPTSSTKYTPIFPIFVWHW